MNLHHRYFIATFLMVLNIAGCESQGSQSVGVTGIVYNYSDETIAFVRVNGKEIGRGIDEARPGEVKGGSGICCFALEKAASKARVEITFWDKSQHETTATIEKWWPDLAHYGVIHILPGRKVVMEVRSVHTWPRKDLMENQLKLLGIKPAYNYTGPMNKGPMERTDGVK